MKRMVELMKFNYAIKRDVGNKSDDGANEYVATAANSQILLLSLLLERRLVACMTIS